MSDSDLIIHVKDYMSLPRPSKKVLRDVDGSVLPMIFVEIDGVEL